MRLTINNIEFNVKVVRSKEDLQKGLRGVKKLPENEGMLFDFGKTKDVEFEMDGTLIDLDIIFIDENKKIISIDNGEAGEEDDYFSEENVRYVLEINPGFDFEEGMEVSFDEGISRDSEGMHIIDSDGTTQGIIKPGSRIFSRKNTKVIVELANIANLEKTDAAYKKLGKKLFLFLDTQDSNEPDYVLGK